MSAIAVERPGEEREEGVTRRAGRALLFVLVLAVLSPLGGAAPVLWELLARAGALFALVMAWRVARLLAGPVAGWIAADCDDKVACTVDACIEGRCYSAAGSCDHGYTCDPAVGCKKDIECHVDADCISQGCGRCDGGTCQYGCGAGEVCCGNSCQGCCSAADCFDGIDCTDNVCADGKCSFPPNNKKCGALQTCNIAKRGCVLL